MGASSQDQVTAAKAETTLLTSIICSRRATTNKRPAVKQGPDLYLEPKWLRCWHYLRCTPHSTVSMKKCWSKSHIIIKITDYLPCWFGEKPRHGCNAAAGLCCIDQASSCFSAEITPGPEGTMGSVEAGTHHFSSCHSTCSLSASAVAQQKLHRSGRNHGASRQK